MSAQTAPIEARSQDTSIRTYIGTTWDRCGCGPISHLSDCEMNLERYQRVALFTDTLNDTAIELSAFARQHDLPLLVVQGPNRPKLREALAEFRADVIHAVHPGDMGLMGTYCAWTQQIPLVLSWEASLPAEGLIG